MMRSRNVTMKVLPVLATLAVAALAGCAYEGINHFYAGSPSSTYDVVTNPPRTNGIVTYDATRAPEPCDYGKSGDATAAMHAH